MLKSSKTISILNAGVLLAVSALTGTGVMAITFHHAKDYIAENQRQVLIRSLSSVLPTVQYDNNIVEDTIELLAPDWLGSKQALTIYRARKAGRPVAAVVTAVAPDGYNGRIKLIVGVDFHGEITGVRVVEHHETPGLGDGIEAERTDWILAFNQRSLNNTMAKQWQVKKDGGDFDQLTGATITPRAIVKAVYKSLKYFKLNRTKIFFDKIDSAQASTLRKKGEHGLD